MATRARRDMTVEEFDAWANARKNVAETLDICDEEGLLIQNEFFVWTGGPGWYPGYARTHDADEMIRQYQDWLRDNWNHPSVVVWDANNETRDDLFGQTIIPAVRPLDLSGRPWENSYNPPADPNDPVEHHPYLMAGGYRGDSFQNGTGRFTLQRSRTSAATEPRPFLPFDRSGAAPDMRPRDGRAGVSDEYL